MSDDDFSALVEIIIDSSIAYNSLVGDEAVRLANKINTAGFSRSAVVDEAALRQAIHAANIRWQAERRREPIADAITRAVVEHLKGGAR